MGLLSQKMLFDILHSNKNQITSEPILFLLLKRGNLTALPHVPRSKAKQGVWNVQSNDQLASFDGWRVAKYTIKRSA